MSKQRLFTKRKGHLFSRVVFTGLAIGFTMISVYSQFKFYQILFGVSTAALISGVLETTRLASLFKFLHTKSGKVAGALTLAAYILTAGVSAWGAVNSFMVEIVQKEDKSRYDESVQIHRIKTAYSKKIEKKLTELEKEISRLQTATARHPKSKYWNDRLSQIILKRDKTITQRDGFLQEEPENRGLWIKANAAKFGLKMEKPSSENESLKNLTAALKELWGIGSGTAKKIIGIVITFTVETGILLLAFLGVAERKSRGVTGQPESVTGNVTKTDDVINSVTQGIDEELLKKFVEANREHFKKTGKLLPMRKLAVNLRPVRKTFEDLKQEDLDKYFEA